MTRSVNSTNGFAVIDFTDRTLDTFYQYFRKKGERSVLEDMFFVTDLDTVFGLLHLDNPYTYYPLSTWKGSIYAITPTNYDEQESLRTTDVLLYPLTNDDIDYIYRREQYDSLNPRQRLLHINDLEHGPVRGFYSNEVYAARVLSSGLFTVDFEYVLSDEPRTLRRDIASYWEFGITFAPDPLAEGAFYEYYLSRD